MKPLKLSPVVSIYTLTAKEHFRIIIQFLFIILAISYLFYNSFFSSILMLPIFYPYYKNMKKYYKKNTQRLLSLQFKETMLSVSASLQVGYSMENAIKRAYQDLEQVYDPKQPIMVELEGMIQKINLNITVEDILHDFSKRSEIEDIACFTDTFMTAKRTGGDLISVISNVVTNISAKLTTKEEIQVVITSKKMEQKMMCIMPLGIILYVRITSPQFLDILYGNLFGAVLMTICLVIYIVAFYLGLKIMDIEV